MKICVLSIVSPKHMTMVRIYTDYLDSIGVKYDFIYLDKYYDNDITGAENTYIYRAQIPRDSNIVYKLYIYWKFRLFGKSAIKRNHYNRVIVWNSYTALLFADYLVLRLKGKYIINIRDYCHENFKIIKFIMNILVRNSFFTTISSDRFKSFLPPNEYFMIHSYNRSLISQLKEVTSLRKKDDIIRINFMGYIRFFDIDMKIIEELGNDSRFSIGYFGEGSERLKNFAESKGITNVKFEGRFNPQDTVQFLKNTDIINNLYGVGKIELDTAISIKLYYAIHLCIPILVAKGTYVSEIAEKNSIGISVNIDDIRGLGDYIYKSYHSLNKEIMAKKCNQFISEIESNNERLKFEIQEFIKEEGPKN